MDLKILHVNSNVLMTNGLKLILSKGGGVGCLANCTEEKQLFHLLKEQEYDLVILDPSSSDEFNLESFLRFRQEFKQQKVLIIAGTNDQQWVLKVMEKGVQGYLTRECDEDEIIHAIFAICKGENFYCNKVLDIILDNREATDCNATTLSGRESEITALIAKGFTNKEIGDRLCLSHHTIHTHRKNIIKKLGVSSVSELTLYALSVGLIEA
mgnify:CR=1 FL=1